MNLDEVRLIVGVPLSAVIYFQIQFAVFDCSKLPSSTAGCLQVQSTVRDRDILNSTAMLDLSFG